MRTNCSTAGCEGSYSAAAAVSARSLARVYIVRSLLPMAKNSASLASMSAVSAAAGTSIMMPSGGSLSGSFTPRARRFAAAWVVDRAGRADFRPVRHHRQHHPHRADHGRAQDGGELGREQVRMSQQHADAAQAERRVQVGGWRHDAGGGEGVDLLLAAPI